MLLHVAFTQQHDKSSRGSHTEQPYDMEDLRKAFKLPSSLSSSIDLTTWNHEQHYKPLDLTYQVTKEQRNAHSVYQLMLLQVS